MFKKLILMVLAISSNYGMDANKKPLENNTIKQNTEDVKDNVGDTPKTVIFQDDEKAFLYSDDVNIPEEDKSANKKIDEQQFAESIDKLFLPYSENNNSDKKEVDDKKLEPKRFDLTSLRPKQFKNMTDDEKDWARLLVYNNFSRLCQAFIQKSFILKKVSRSLKDSFWNAREPKLCMVTGLDIKQIFLDELNFNTNKSCYQHRPPVLTQLVLFCCHFPKVQQSYRKKLLENGIIDSQ